MKEGVNCRLQELQERQAHHGTPQKRQTHESLQGQGKPVQEGKEEYHVVEFGYTVFLKRL
jgi:hypothetical protein